MSVAVLKRKERVDDSHLSAIPNPMIRQIAANRKVASMSELDYTLKNVLHYSSFKDIDKAAALIADAIEGGKKIVIAGDYDCDGCTATSIMMRGLKMCGSENHAFMIPDRELHGYGLGEPFVGDIAKKHGVGLGDNDLSLLITVDSGISNIEGVAKAKSYGWNVLITDHHLPGEEIPNADAIVNPQLPDCEFPSKNVAGCGVAWYVIVAASRELEARGFYEDQERPNVVSLLDIVALGTVADLVGMDYNNRVLVTAGLNIIRAGRACPGINGLLAVAGKNWRTCTETDFGFALGPRINAAGRLGSMAPGVHCLIEDNVEVADELATQLDQLNAKRKEKQSGMEVEAHQMIESVSADGMKAGVALYGPDWPEGIIGIMAGQVKEKLGRPVIVFSDAHDGLIKGSGRSIPALHLRDTLALIDKAHPDMIHGFGGHHMACGLSVRKELFEEFRSAFERIVDEALSPDDYNKVIVSDGELEPADLSLNFIDSMRQIAPYGQKFEEPIFDGEFIVQKCRILNDKHLRLDVRSAHGSNAISGIMFNVPDIHEKWGGQLEGVKVQLAYKLSKNEFTPRGATEPRITPQMMLEYAERV